MEKMLRVRIPMLPPAQCSPNWRGHWAVRWRIAKAYREAAYWAAYAALGGKHNQFRKAELSITLVVPSSRYTRDPDNMLASLKPAIDGCVDAGVIPDDSDKYLQVRLPIMYRIRRGGDRETIFEFKEVK